MPNMLKSIYLVMVCGILSSCSLFNHVASVRDEDIGYLNRSEYIEKAQKIVKVEHPDYKDLLVEDPTVYRARYWVDRIFDREVTVMWRKDVEGQDYSHNPIIFRSVRVSLERSGEIRSHSSGKGKGYYNMFLRSLEQPPLHNK